VDELAAEVEVERWHPDRGAVSGRAPLRRRPDDHLFGFAVLAQTLEARLERTGRQAGQAVGGAVGPQPGRQRLADVLREQQAQDRQGTLLPAVGANETESSATKSPRTGPG